MHYFWWQASKWFELALVCCLTWYTDLTDWICSLLDFGLLTTAIKVSKSRHYLGTKLYMYFYIYRIEIRHNVALDLHVHYSFSSYFLVVTEKSELDLQTDRHKHTKYDYMCLWDSTHRCIIFLLQILYLKITCLTTNSFVCCLNASAFSKVIQCSRVADAQLKQWPVSKSESLGVRIGLLDSGVTGVGGSLVNTGVILSPFPPRTLLDWSFFMS